MLPRSLPPSIRSRGVTAVLGPTNTGKTHLAIERMIGHNGGLIGLPLRLLAREVYQRVVDRVGADAVALVTGEEKIKPPNARFWVATVEAMPRDIEAPFVAIDEIQLAADRDRGHVFTDRLLNMRGRAETLLIGSATMKPLIEKLIPGVNVVSRPRLSKLSFAGEKKLTRLPRRSAIVAFSAEEVYAIAELIRRQRGGAAVVLGALSPRTRNAQVKMYQEGEVDFLVATDAIGMGLNLDVDHVAFAADRKFDGGMHRRLTPSEFGQIAGRAGRHLRDGTFGTTGRCPPFDPELVNALEDHRFDSLQVLQWRNPDLDFSTVASLTASLERFPSEHGLTRALAADDLLALEIAGRDEELKGYATSRAAVERLWEVCQIPDYRRLAPQAHAELIATVYRQLMRTGQVGADWFSRQVNEVDRTEGDIDALSSRIAQVRTWTFVANRPDWLSDPEHWQRVTRQVEDRLSDALHERLAQRFVDRRTSMLMRRLRENAMLEAEITAAGDVLVEGLHVGRLQGFQFAPDAQAAGPEAKALRNAALKARAGEIEGRAARLAQSPDDAFVLSNDGALRWQGEVIAKLTAGDKLLEPRLRLLADEQLTGSARDQVQARIDLWIKAHVEKLLGPLLKLEAPDALTGMARGLGFQIAESLGVLERARVADDVKSLDQEARSALRNYGVRFGAYHLTVPSLLKPAPRGLAAQLWALKHGGPDVKGLDDILHLASSGRTSIPVDKEVAKGLYRAAGFRVCGERAVRVDILERLADLIRPAIHYRPGVTPGEPPAGAADGEGFVVTTAMTSLCGCAGEDFASILRSLGYVMDRRAGPAIRTPLLPEAAKAPVVVSVQAGAAGGSEAEANGREAAVPGQSAPDQPEPGAAAAEPTPAEALLADFAMGDAVAVVDQPEPAANFSAAAKDEVAQTPEITSLQITSPEVTSPEPALPEPALPEPASPEPLAADNAATSDEPSAETPEEIRVELHAEGQAEPPVPVAESAEEIVAEALPDEAAAPEAAAPIEIPMIEVWRQHRHQGGQRQGRDRRPGRGAPGEARPAGQGRPRHERPRVDAAPGEAVAGEQRPTGDGPQGERPRSDRPHGRPRGDRPVGDRPGGENPAGERGFRGRQGGDKPVGDRPGGDRAGGDRPRGDRPQGGDRPGFAAKGGPEGGRGKGGDRGPRREGGGKPWQERNGGERSRGDRGWQDPADRQRDKAPDPNSPFAKLLALKAELEAKRDGKG